MADETNPEGEPGRGSIMSTESVQEAINAVEKGAIAVYGNDYPDDRLYHVFQTQDQVDEFKRLTEALKAALNDEEAEQAYENFEKFHAKYPFQTAIIDMKETMLINFLLSSPSWRLIYFDRSSVVIVQESVIPSLNPEALSVDMSTSKFADVHNPEVLERVFNFYLNINRDYAREILELYEKNVTDYYAYKERRLKWMRYILNSSG